MRGLTGLVLKIPKARVVALALFVSLSTFLVPVTSYAEDPPSSEPSNQTEPVAPIVESPIDVRATSPSNDRTIVWTWSPPESGLTPDVEDVEEGGDPISTTPVEHSTDIVSFGYELTKDDVLIGTPPNVIDATDLTVTTPVDANGDYTLHVWSITRAGEVSAKATGMVTIFVPIPNLPPIEDAIIPTPIHTAPIVAMPIAGTANAAPTPSAGAANEPGYEISAPSASVLGNNVASDNLDEVASAGVAKTSNQGWVILGVPWYFWLLILAASYVAMRYVVRFTANL